MAESIVSVTEGSGKKLHTFSRTVGANTVEDEFVVVGEQPLATYIATTSTVSTATADSHLVQVMAGASLPVYIRRIEVYQVGLATTASLAQLLLFRLTSAGTGGTVLGPAPLDGTDAASGATAMTLPTVKGTEAAAKFYSATAYLMQTLGASAQLNQPILVFDAERLRSKALRITAGTTNGIALKIATSGVAAATVYINVWFSEASY
jgi:hypothetical protein